MIVEYLGPHVRLHPAGPLHGTVRPPGSKSLTNRYLACAALADGVTRLHGASPSDDTQAMRAGLAQLGVATTESGPTGPAGAAPAGRSAAQATPGILEVAGTRGNLTGDAAEIDVGNAGTAMRFLTALACLGFGRRRLDGSARMRARPIGELVDALRQLGAGIGYERAEGYPPLTVLAQGLAGGELVFRQPPSSQFLSAVLMVAPYAGQDVLIAVEGPLPSRPYVDMTLEVMRELGVEAVAGDEARFVVPAFQRYRAGEYAVEPDASAASYFWAAAAATGGQVRVAGLSRASRQGDVGFVDVLARMGCQVHEDADGLAVAGRAGDASAGRADGPRDRLRGVDVDLNAMPDTAQTLAVLALFADGPTRIRNVANLKVKETDRIAALAAELTKLGAQVAAAPDGLTITPPARLTPAAIDTYDDHRMAMSFAVAGLVAEGITIRDAGCVAKSYPRFFAQLARLVAGPADSA